MKRQEPDKKIKEQSNNGQGSCDQRLEIGERVDEKGRGDRERGRGDRERGRGERGKREERGERGKREEREGRGRRERPESGEKQRGKLN